MLRATLLGTRPGGFMWLLASLMVLLVAGALLTNMPGGEGVSHVLLGLTLVASVYPVSHNRVLAWIGGVLAVLTLGGLLIADVSGSRIAEAAGLGVGVAFYLAAAFVVLFRVLMKTRISTDDLAAAVSVYLLLGIAGAFLFAFIELLVPGSIIDTTGAATVRRTLNEYLYFSFTCLTTLGFGDLVPASPPARAFAYLEAVTGQVYLTILVARLVGLHLTQTHGGHR